ncbi:MAG: diguanylate cyclase [Gammaproteobacteria bacterium]|nr:MAG: diguanylate cyclase [Gammaproteobacteria bacterium]
MSKDAHNPDSEKPRVLVVDDSRLMRKAINKFIEREFEATEAEDGEQGWQMLVDDDQIQVVIADVLMPRLDGYALICRIRAADAARIRDVPVIVITGAEDEETRERAFACGANDFITKPIDGARLIECTRAQAKLDQTSRKLAHAADILDEQASIDPLTQLNSRRLFVQRGSAELATARDAGTELSLIRLDIDNFRTIYSEHGDDSGDRLLVWVANIIIAQTRGGDILARVGGGEFAAVTPRAGRLEAAVLCERLRSAINKEPFKHNGISIPVTVSLGVVTLGRDPGNTIDELLDLADQRVAAAGAAGGNRLSVEEMDESKNPDTVIVAQPDINTALEMMRHGDTGKLDPYLPELALKVLPLIELCNDKLDLAFDLELNSLKEKLSQLK